MPSQQTASARPRGIRPVLHRHYVDGISLHGLLSQIRPSQRLAWEETTGPKVLCYLADPHAFTVPETRSHIETAVRHILGAPHAPSVLAPKVDSSSPGERAVVYLVSGLSSDAANLLTRFNTWIVPGVPSIFTYAWDGTPSPFVTTLTGITVPDSRLGRRTIELMVRNAILSDDRLLAFAKRMRDITPDEGAYTLKYLLSTVEVATFKHPCVGVNDFASTHWVIYAAPPSKNGALLKRWRELVTSAVTNFMATQETPRIAKTTVCGRCLATSHSAPHCPFTTLEGWSTATPVNHVTFLEPTATEDEHFAFSGESVVITSIPSVYDEAQRATGISHVTTDY